MIGDIWYTPARTVVPFVLFIIRFIVRLMRIGVLVAMSCIVLWTVSAATATTAVAAATIDLKPSFQKSLPHVKVCGVIVIQADFPLNQIDDRIRDIDALQYDIGRYLAIPAPQEKVELCLFQNEQSYKSFLKREFPSAPTNHPALFVKKNGPGILMVPLGPNFDVDLRHEMTHAILHATVRNIPIWLDEGLAKYFEVPSEQRARDNPYMKTVKRYCQFGTIPSLSRLEKLQTIDDMGIREYRESWSWVHFLMHRSEATHLLLAKYLTGLSTAVPEFSGGNGSNGIGGIIKKPSSSASLPSMDSQLRSLMSSPRAEFLEHFRYW